MGKRIHPKSEELKRKLREARLLAWITRRKKYGSNGNGKYHATRR